MDFPRHFLAATPPPDHFGLGSLASAHPIYKLDAQNHAQGSRTSPGSPRSPVTLGVWFGFRQRRPKLSAIRTIFALSKSPRAPDPAPVSCCVKIASSSVVAAPLRLGDLRSQAPVAGCSNSRFCRLTIAPDTVSADGGPVSPINASASSAICAWSVTISIGSWAPRIPSDCIAGNAPSPSKIAGWLATASTAMRRAFSCSGSVMASARSITFSTSVRPEVLISM